MNVNAYKKRLQRNGGQCQHPKCTATTNLTVDHIIPRHFLKCLGMEYFADTDETNFQIMCQKHNVEKANQLDYTNPKTLPLLKKYVNIWIEKHADYFVPPEKRVYKIGVVCKCHPLVETVPASVGRDTWRTRPGMAPTLKPDVVRTKEQVDGDKW